jgi:hypothetical protein
MEKRMSADVPGNTTTAPNGQPPAGLPPVVPPSGRHIAQMFVVPALIVAVIVFLWLCARWFIAGQSEPSKMVADLSDGNAEVRWRAANELAQHLMRDESLASDPKLALELSELLRKRLDEYDDAVKPQKEGAATTSHKEMVERRKDVQFLVACVGNLMLPTGSDLLCKVITRGNGTDEKGGVMLRRDAVFSLGNLGNNLARLEKLSEDRRAEIIETLEAELAAKPSGDAKRWTENSLDHLQAVQAGRQPSSHGVIAALADAAADSGDDSDPFLRELVAHALNFWHGTASEEEQIDATLVKLSHDDGNGKTYNLEDGD